MNCQGVDIYLAMLFLTHFGNYLGIYIVFIVSDMIKYIVYYFENFQLNYHLFLDTKYVIFLDPGKNLSGKCPQICL